MKDSLQQQQQSDLGISIVIPTLNEAENVKALVHRLSAALDGISYELIFIDDNSSDQTVEILLGLQKDHPLAVYTKNGKPGKAFSLQEGFERARYQYVAMMDADLQYPPEALPNMLKIVASDEADIVVANRRSVEVSRLRKTFSRMYRTIFGRWLWNLPVDIQSGQKVFRQDLIHCFPKHPRYAWACDLEFLLIANNAGYRLANYDIEFTERIAGKTKVRLLSTMRQLTFSSLRLRVRPPYHVPFHTEAQKKDGPGFFYRGQKYITHTTLGPDDMAVTRTSFGQRFFLLLLSILVLLAFFTDWRTALMGLISVVTAFYFLDLLFNLYLIMRSFYEDREIQVPTEVLEARTDWPTYTVFCPLYKESAVLPQFVQAMQDIDYPSDKLEVMLLLEADDTETVQAAEAMSLPSYFSINVVPHGLPKTKPKACNYGLQKASGEYAVIYDAEDVPDPLQLKKAVMAFDRLGDKVGCIQAKLNYYNSDQNVLTRLFTLEYSLWFNLILTGLQSVQALIPLGGTSNHFRVADLRDFEGWDPFNVTEDADLGIRLAKRGMQTAILDSFTLEEANSEIRNWIKQRSRWIKGYMQTYLVHMRSPRRLMRHRKVHIITLQLVVGGKILALLINPLLWLMTLTYLFVEPARTFIQDLYLTPVLYIGVLSLVFGNFLYMYYYMLGASKHDRPELITYALLIPVYWLMMSVAAVYALHELIVRPHHWHKTKHGLHLKSSPAKKDVSTDTLPEAA